jgi:putative membrane protein
VKPVLRLLTLPITMATLGLFLLVLNALLLLLVGWISGELGLAFTVDGFLPAILGSIIISLVGLLLSTVIGAGRRAV